MQRLCMHAAIPCPKSRPGSSWYCTLIAASALQQAEDLEDASSLTALYQVLRSAVLLNDTALLEELLREEHVMDVMGALEYDPETPAAARAQHRKFLKVGGVELEAGGGQGQCFWGV